MPKRSKYIGIRCYPGDFSEIETAAILCQLPTSVWCRRAVIEAARREIDRAAKIGDPADLVAPFYGDGAEAMRRNRRDKDDARRGGTILDFRPGRFEGDE